MLNFISGQAPCDVVDSMVVSLLGVVRGMKSRSPPIIKVSALTGEGLEKLEGAIEVVRSRFDRGDLDLKLRSVRGMIVETARWTLMERLSKVSQEKAEMLARLVVGGELSIDEAAARLVR